LRCWFKFTTQILNALKSWGMQVPAKTSHGLKLSVVHPLVSATQAQPRAAREGGRRADTFGIACCQLVFLPCGCVHRWQVDNLQAHPRGCTQHS
jgi:hypothetical protein